MRLTFRDAIASVLVALVLVPYVGYLIRGEMPFIQDPRGMAATGLVLGTAAFLVAGRPTGRDTLGKVEFGLALAALTVGIVTLGLAETAAAEALLVAFIAAIVVLWATQMLHHAGFIPTRTPRTIGTGR